MKAAGNAAAGNILILRLGVSGPNDHDAYISTQFTDTKTVLASDNVMDGWLLTALFSWARERFVLNVTVFARVSFALSASILPKTVFDSTNKQVKQTTCRRSGKAVEGRQNKPSTTVQPIRAAVSQGDHWLFVQIGNRLI